MHVSRRSVSSIRSGSQEKFTPKIMLSACAKLTDRTVTACLIYSRAMKAVVSKSCPIDSRITHFLSRGQRKTYIDKHSPKRIFDVGDVCQSLLCSGDRVPVVLKYFM